MRTLRAVIVCLWLLGLLHATHGKDTAAPAATDTATSTKSDSPTASIQPAADPAVSKDKRQVGDKETALYPNHRSDSNVQDDLEDGQETIYGGSAKANRFLIRPLQHQSQKEDAEETELHQQQIHHSHQQQQQQRQQQQRSALLRNYPVTIRPHSTQQLEQSQEIQHFAYLQDLSRHQASKNAVDGQEKLHLTSTSSAASSKKAARLLASAAQNQSPTAGGSSSSSSSSGSNGGSSNSANAEEAEQRYAVTVQAAPPPSRHYQPGPPYASPGGQQPYQIIPEEHFLRLIEQELQARAYHEDQQLRHLQQQHQQHQQQQRLSAKNGPQGERGPSPPPPPGLGSYRQRLAENLSEPPPSAEQPQHYVQYVPRHRGGPKYLPLAAAQVSEPQVSEPQDGDIPPEPVEAPQHLQPQQQEIPPQLAYYQPQISYKTLPNHPLAKSSLEKEIEKLLAANKPNVQLFDSNENPSLAAPTLSPRHHHTSAPKSFISSTTPNSLLDANNQPFIPSLFQFSNFQSPTPVYPTEVAGPQHGYTGKKVGPVVYPQATPQPNAQPTQYYYQQQQQDISPTGKPKGYRSKPVYGSKVAPPSGPEAAASLKPREKALASAKYPTVQTLLYEYGEQPSAQTGPVQFHPSPLDPTKPQPTPAVHHQGQSQGPPAYRQYVLPAPAPSQSNIYVSQGTGVVTPSRPQPQPQHHQHQQPSHHSSHSHHQAQASSSASSKTKTVDDVKRLRLPSPGSGGKPLTQEEFQQLVDAGYPVTAVPVPVPVPYDQYVKDHPEYRNQPVDYTQLMRLAQQQYSAIPQHQQQQHHQQQHHHQQHHQQQSSHRHQHRSLGVASEPSVKIISSPGATATGIGGGSITYLRPIASRGQEDQKRHPRNEKDTKVAGGAGEEKVEVAVEASTKPKA